MSRLVGVLALVLAAGCADDELSPSRAAHAALADASLTAGVESGVNGSRSVAVVQALADAFADTADIVDIYVTTDAPADLSPLEGTLTDHTLDLTESASAAQTAARTHARLPVVRAVSSPGGYLPVVFCDEPERVVKVEFRASMGRSNLVLDGTLGELPFRVAQDDPELLRFHHMFVDSLAGELVVRPHYDDGEVWRRSVRRDPASLDRRCPPALDE